jgi:hypothetical protein
MPIQTAIDSISNSQGSPFGFKNRIINGGMVIDQRNAGASVLGNAFVVDRFGTAVSQSAKLTAQQNAGSVTPPTGFTNYLGITSSSAYTINSTDYFLTSHKIEGYNIADLAWGTSSAATITLSFWVRSSLTGTFGGAVQNSAQNRSYPFSYTINSANTWEKETITIPGDTTGTWLTTNGAGILLWFGLGVGSSISGTAGAWAGTNYNSATGATSVVGTNGATWYVTGVQLEVGRAATSFDFRSVTTELQLCQRYYYKTKSYLNRISGGYNQATTESNLVVQFPVSLRIAPTSLEQSGTASDYRLVFSGTSGLCSVVPLFSIASTENGGIVATVASGMTVGQTSQLRFENNNSYLAWSAEL